MRSFILGIMLVGCGDQQERIRVRPFVAESSLVVYRDGDGTWQEPKLEGGYYEFLATDTFQFVDVIRISKTNFATMHCPATGKVTAIATSDQTWCLSTESLMTRPCNSSV